MMESAWKYSFNSNETLFKDKSYETIIESQGIPIEIELIYSDTDPEYLKLPILDAINMESNEWW